jgi:hypothetical protein
LNPFGLNIKSAYCDVKFRICFLNVSRSNYLFLTKMIIRRSLPKRQFKVPQGGQSALSLNS